MTDVVVAGGGLAGLVAARRLAERGHAVTLFEERDRVGGRVGSRTVDGYTCDRGFQVLFPTYPAVRRELDLGALDLRRFAAGATIARPGRREVVADPRRHPTTVFETLSNADVALADLPAMLKLWWSLRGGEAGDGLPGDPQSIREYLDGFGLSPGLLEHVFAPFYGGITLDRSLETDAAVFTDTFRALAAGRAAVPADGMGAIPDQLARRAREAGVTILHGQAVETLDAGGDGVTVTAGGETVGADAAVVATDPPTARDLTGVESIPTAGRGCVTLHLALPEGPSLPAGRRLVLNATEPGPDGGPNHVAATSAVAPEYAPAGATLLSATFLGRPEADDEALVERTRDALAEWFPVRDFGALEHLATDRIPFAQFDQPPGIRDRLPDADVPEGPVVLAGDYTRWSAIQGALQSGADAADRLDGHLT